MDDGPRDELRKEHHEKAVFEERVRLDLPSPGVHQIGDLLEGEEGDRKRQYDVLQLEPGIQDGVRRSDQEVCVFEEGERGEVDRHAESRQVGRPTAPRFQPLRHDRARHHEIEDGKADQQWQVNRVPPAIEEERGQNEETEACLAAKLRPDDKAQQRRQRQEAKEEYGRIKEQLARRAPAPKGVERTGIGRLPAFGRAMLGRTKA
jgi:uncharacterized protein YhaN